jgi:hypothetical protein
MFIETVCLYSMALLLGAQLVVIHIAPLKERRSLISGFTYKHFALNRAKNGKPRALLRSGSTAVSLATARRDSLLPGPLLFCHRLERFAEGARRRSPRP